MSAGLDENLLDMYRAVGLPERVLALGEATEVQYEARFTEIDAITEYDRMKVLNILREHRIGEAHLSSNTGYDYNDTGRDALEAVHASALGMENALTGAQLVSGTHALTAAPLGNPRPDDEILSSVGKPCNTLDEVIGIHPQHGGP